VNVVGWFWVGQYPCKFSNGIFTDRLSHCFFPREERPSTSIGIGYLFGEERRNILIPAILFGEEQWMNGDGEVKRESSRSFYILGAEYLGRFVD